MNRPVSLSRYLLLTSRKNTTGWYPGCGKHQATTHRGHGHGRARHHGHDHDRVHGRDHGHDRERASAFVVLDVSAKPVIATVLTQYMATIKKPATTRAKRDLFFILVPFSSLCSSTANIERSSALEVHFDDENRQTKPIFCVESALSPCIQAYWTLF